MLSHDGNGGMNRKLRVCVCVLMHTPVYRKRRIIPIIPVRYKYCGKTRLGELYFSLGVRQGEILEYKIFLSIRNICIGQCLVLKKRPYALINL